MKKLSLLTIFLTVNFFLTSVGWGQTTITVKTDTATSSNYKDRNCEANCIREAENKCESLKDQTKKAECIKDNIDICNKSCAIGATSTARCDTLAEKYFDARKKANEQCGRLEGKTENNQSCLERARKCEEGMSTDPKDNSQLLNSVFGAYASTKGLPNGNQQFSQPINIPPGCALEDDDKEETSKEKIQDKIQKLNEDIADLQKEQKEVDKELSEKKDKVTEDIQKLQEEIDKNKTDRQTEDQKKAADIAKSTLNAEKTQSKALLDIDAKNREINQVKLSAQSKVLQYSDTNLLLACKSQIEEKKKSLIAANKGKGSKGTSEVKNILQAFADTCIQSAKASRKQELQTLQDKIAQLNSDIAEKNKDIEQSKKTIKQEQANLDALKSISDQAEQKELQMQQSKTNRLNQSVIDMQVYIEGKKKSMDDKIKVKMAAISDLIAARNKKKPKYRSVYSEAEDAQGKLEKYQASCCGLEGAEGKLCPDGKKANTNLPAKPDGTSR